MVEEGEGLEAVWVRGADGVSKSARVQLGFWVVSC